MPTGTVTMVFPTQNLPVSARTHTSTGLNIGMELFQGRSGRFNRIPTSNSISPQFSINNQVEVATFINGRYKHLKTKYEPPRNLRELGMFMDGVKRTDHFKTVKIFLLKPL